MFLKVGAGIVLLAAFFGYQFLPDKGVSQPSELVSNIEHEGAQPLSHARSSLGVQEASSITEIEPNAVDALPPPQSDVTALEPAAVLAPTPENAAGLREAIVQALTSGSAGRWKVADWSGGVSVSSPQQNGAKECRSYRYTVDQNDDPTAAHDGTACRSEGADWELAL